MATDFDAAARTWDSPEKVDRSARIAEAIADAVPLDPAWSALDYGCGTGRRPSGRTRSPARPKFARTSAPI